MAKDKLGHGSDKRGGGVDQSKPIKDAGIIRAKGISAMYGPGSPGYPAHGSGVQQVGKQSVDLMSKDQLDKLRTEFSGIKGIDPMQPTYGKLTAFLSDTHPDRLKQLADANIPFLSNLARNRLPAVTPYSAGQKVTVDGKPGEISHVQTAPRGYEHGYRITDTSAKDPFRQTRLEGGNYIPHNRVKPA